MSLFKTCSMHFFYRIIGSLTSDVFERRTPTRSKHFSLLICLDATKFVLLSVFTLKETICPKVCSKSWLKNAKGSLLVDERRSKTPLLIKVLLKIMTENGIYSPPMKVISNTFLFVYSLCGALIKIARGYHTRWRNYFD